MKCTTKGNKKFMSHKTSDCLIEVVAKAGLTVYLSVGTPRGTRSCVIFGKLNFVTTLNDEK